ERAEQRVGADSEEADAHDLAVLRFGYDARLPHELRLVLEDLVDDAPVDVELVGPEALDALLDVVRDVARAPVAGGHRCRRRGDRAARGRRRLEHLRLAELGAGGHPHAIPTDELHDAPLEL